MDKPRSDALVLFGATGDLAHKKIFPAVYEMERARNCDVPVIGVASSEWDDEALRQRARESIDARDDIDFDDTVWKGLAAQLSYVSGDYREASTFEALAAKLAGVERPLHYLAIPPSMFDDVVQGLERGRADRAGVAGGGREAVRPRRGVGRRAQRRAPPGVPRGGDLPDRPLPRQGVGGEPAGLPVRQLDARTAVEPQLHLQRAGDDGRGLRRRDPGPVLRVGRCAAGRVPEPPAAGDRPPGDGAAGVGGRERAVRREDPAVAPDPGHRPGQGRAGPVPGLRRRDRGRCGQRRRDVRRAPTGDRVVALGRCSLARADRARTCRSPPPRR